MQRVLITGAAAGIGQATAIAFAMAGARLVIADVTEQDETEEILRSTSGDFRCVSVDVRSERSVVDMVHTSVDFLGNIDVAVHCAGILRHRPLLETTSADFDEVLAVNLRGTFLTGREVLRQMQACGKGHLINIASDLSYLGREEFSSYCASKAGVLSLTRTWALEFAPAVLVNAVCPGPIDTAMLGAQNMSAKWRERELDIPLRRFGTPAEIANFIVFLASRDCSFVTGQGFGVNGGSVMA